MAEYGPNRGQVLDQWFPTFLTSGTSFMEDHFSTDRVGGDGSRGNASDEGDSSGSNASNGEQQRKLGSLACCSPPAVQPDS